MLRILHLEVSNYISKTVVITRFAFINHSYLNGFGPLQIGGVENSIRDMKINFTGFSGCIRNIYNNGRMYDLFNPLKEVNTELGCRLNNPCPNCNGRGYCEPFWNYAICVCDLGFGGANCDSSKSYSLVM